LTDLRGLGLDSLEPNTNEYAEHPRELHVDEG